LKRMFIAYFYAALDSMTATGTQLKYSNARILETITSTAIDF